MAVSKSHIKASRQYEKRNPDRTGYNTLKRNAVNFVSAYTKEGTKANQYVTSDYGKKHYKEDLTELENLIKQTLEELEN